MDLIIIEAPGKRRTWEAFLKRAKMSARVLPTRGHVCDFPRKLSPLGVSLFRDEPDFGRVVNESKAEDILAAVRRTDGRVFIATDNDPEGGVIALDVLKLISRAFPQSLDRIFRIYPKSMGFRDLNAAISGPQPINKPTILRMYHESVEGRARAMTDRLIGAVLSRRAGVPIGRIRTSVPGTVLLHSAKDGARLLAGEVELGEIMFEARPLSGGKMFKARIPVLTGDDPARITRLTEMARKFGTRVVPGKITVPQPVGAAVAPRFGKIVPFSTGDVVVHAGRHHGLRPHIAMAGLHRAYMRGDVSYPKTDSKIYSSEVASMVCSLGASLGIEGLSPACATEIDRKGRQHDALHPICGNYLQDIERLSEIVRTDWNKVFPPIPEEGEDHDPHPDTVADLMTALVARRAFEASRDVLLEYGYWRPGNSAKAAALSEEESDLLESLDWQRESGKMLPWDRSLSPGIRVWPGESIILDMMMTEDLARPFTLPSHLKAIMDAGYIKVTALNEVMNAPNPFRKPEITARGREMITRAPSDIWKPSFGRMIAAAISSDALDSATKVEEIIRGRVIMWMMECPEKMAIEMLRAMKSGDVHMDPEMEKDLLRMMNIDLKQTAMDLPETKPQPRH